MLLPALTALLVCAAGDALADGRPDLAVLQGVAALHRLTQ